MEWKHVGAIDADKAKRIGELSAELKALKVSGADTAKVALLKAWHDGAPVGNYGIAWENLCEALDLRDYSKIKDATPAERAMTTTYKTLYAGIKRACETTIAVNYTMADGTRKQLVPPLTLDRILQDAEFDGQIDCLAALANWKSEVNRRNALVKARKETLDEENRRMVALAAKREHDDMIEKLVRERLESAKTTKTTKTTK